MQGLCFCFPTKPLSVQRRQSCLDSGSLQEPCPLRWPCWGSIPKWKQFAPFLPHLPYHEPRTGKSMHFQNSHYPFLIKWSQIRTVTGRAYKKQGLLFLGLLRYGGAPWVGGRAGGSQDLAEQAPAAVEVKHPCFQPCRSCSGKLTWASWGAPESFLLSTGDVRVLCRWQRHISRCKGTWPSQWVSFVGLKM